MTNLIDELHLTVRVPVDLPEGEIDAIRRVLTGEEFLNRLSRLIQDAFWDLPELTPCRVSLTR